MKSLILCRSVYLTFYLLSKAEEDARLCRSKRSEASELLPIVRLALRKRRFLFEVDDHG